MINAFIRKNTPELIKDLKELGYVDWSVEPFDCGIVTSTFNFKWQSALEPNKLTPILIGAASIEDFDEYIEEGYIDCGENELLFLAIAALNDNTDKYQWFVLDADVELTENTYAPKGSFVYCIADKQEITECHKATLQELLEYFK